ncbi:MAG: hypothetical protein JO167_07860 [Alphaproteobacteria bacterium]|nr:hypothetical protein [Alphaproteobacteria bacterium]MBV9541170.1 hypothetical protein [Alphaproteobacteria bacterium]
MTTGAIASLVGIGGLAATTTAADARVVCNRYGDCWRETVRYDYPSALGVRFYDDNWRHRYWRDRDRYRSWRWRADHQGRGYWRNGIWITF